MPNYDTADKVADFLATFKMHTSLAVTDNHSINHFNVALKRYGDNFYASYDKAISADDASTLQDPTVFEVVSALISDASMADRYHIGDFLDTFSDTRKPSQAYDAYESCKAARDWMHDSLHLTRSDISEINEVLKSEPDAVRTAYEKAAREQAEKEAEQNPPVPKGFISVEELQDNLDLGEFEDEISDASFDSDDLDDIINECADNSADVYTSKLAKWYVSHAGLVDDAAEGKTLGDGCTIDGIIMSAQCDYARSDLNGHKENICIYGTLDVLKDNGLYAINRELADDILNGDVDFEVDCVPTGDVEEVIFDNFYTHLEERYGDEVADTLTDAMRDADKPFDFVNPYALSRDAVRSVNDLGFDAAFQKSFAPVLEENELSLDAISLDREAKNMSESKDALTENVSHEKDEVETEKPPATDNSEHE